MSHWASSLLQDCVAASSSQKGSEWWLLLHPGGRESRADDFGRQLTARLAARRGWQDVLRMIGSGYRKIPDLGPQPLNVVGINGLHSPVQMRSVGFWVA